jgi:DNA polymerase I-like protein with 3'-5' exonuclease and polymerase domains
MTPFPTPPRVLVETGSELRSMLEALPRGSGAAVGICVEPPAGLPRHTADDPRTGPPAQLAIAPGGDAPVFVVIVERVGDIDPLLQWLTLPEAPYAVFHGAQAALHRLGAAARLPDAFAPARLGCTQIAAALLAAGQRHGLPTLEGCAAKVLDLSLAEPHLRSLGGADPETLDDVARRAAITIPLMRELTPRLRSKDLVRSYQLECDVLPAVVAMERAGFAVDGAQFQRVADGWKAEREQTEDPERIARLDKLLSTYAYWPREYVRGDRIYARLHPLAADSGRFSCTDPNLQQVPRGDTAPGLRACFVPPAGHVLVVADYSQIELRVAAHLAPCDAMRTVFREGRDPHRATAATITGRPEVEITERERRLAKAVNFGFLFGMGPARFRQYAHDSYGVELDETAARRARDAFLRTFPGIAEWHRRVGALGRRGGSVTVRTALGRRKKFDAERFSFNAALNIPVQGTAADGFKLAMTRLHPRLQELGARGVLVVHDEYVAECPQERAEEVREIVQRTMIEAMSEVVTSVPIEVEASVCATWADKA